MNKWKGKYKKVKGTVVSNLQTEGEREIKCEGMIDDHKRKFQWWAWMSQINWEVVSCFTIYFQNSFGTGRHLWIRSQTSWEKNWLFKRKEDFERLKEKNFKNNKYFISKEINKNSWEVVRKKKNI